eukprot:scaffold110603_cov34-Tisochrysis_lutea.AAC.6
MSSVLSQEEEDMLDLAYERRDTSRLGCQIILSPKIDGLEVEIPPGTEYNVPAVRSAKLPKKHAADSQSSGTKHAVEAMSSSDDADSFDQLQDHDNGPFSIRCFCETVVVGSEKFSANMHTTTATMCATSSGTSNNSKL